MGKKKKKKKKTPNHRLLGISSYPLSIRESSKLIFANNPPRSVCEIHPEAVPTTHTVSARIYTSQAETTSGRRLLKRDINISPRSRTSPLIYVTRPLRIVVDRPKMDESRARVIQSGRGKGRAEGRLRIRRKLGYLKTKRARSIARD